MGTTNNRYVSERFGQILEYLDKHIRATVEELAGVLYVSPATVRRDLSEMQRQGLLQRTHGGAMVLCVPEEASTFMNIQKEAVSMEAVVKVALSHMPSFKSCFFDNSSASFALATRMNLENKTVVTNGLQLAARLAEKKSVDVILLGGHVTASGYASFGPFPTQMSEGFRLDMVVLSADSVILEGAFGESVDIVDLKQRALERGKQKILLADKSKFGDDSVFRIAPLSDFDLICTDADDATIKPFLNEGFHVVNK